METLKVLPDITRLSDCVVRILGQVFFPVPNSPFGRLVRNIDSSGSQNPGKFTLQGTNTYLVGKQPPFILVDTGEGRDAYPPLLEGVLKTSRKEASVDLNASSVVSDIIITHRHHDHYGGLLDVLNLLRKLYDEEGDSADYVPPRIHKFPSPLETEESIHETGYQSMLASLTACLYHPSPSGSPVHQLNPFQRIPTIDGSISLEVLHTPGHTPDSICLLLRNDTGNKVLFSADTVLGQGTAVFEDLGMYIRSLRQILEWRDDETMKADFKDIYPGHGPVVDDGPSLIAAYIKHRMEREAQIVDVLAKQPPRNENSPDELPSAWTVWGVVGQIYKEYPEDLWLPAAHSVVLHLKKLEDEGRARRLGGEGVDQRWML